MPTETTPLSADLQALLARQQAAWTSGDYAVIGTTILLIAELLAEAMDVHAGWTVLDVAAGHGNASLACARRGCRVTSTDYVPALLERGKVRAAAEGLRIDFQVANALELPFADASFDAVISTVGVMFAPDPARVAAELYRVVRPGGVIGLASWTPESLVGGIFRILGSYLPPPPGSQPPSLWGTEQRLAELFPAASITSRFTDFKFRDLSVADWLDHFRTFYGPMVKAYAALDEQKQEALSRDLIALAESKNTANDGTMSLPVEYLEAVIHKP